MFYLWILRLSFARVPSQAVRWLYRCASLEHVADLWPQVWVRTPLRQRRPRREAVWNRDWKSRAFSTAGRPASLLLGTAAGATGPVRPSGPVRRCSSIAVVTLKIADRQSLMSALAPAWRYRLAPAAAAVGPGSWLYPGSVVMPHARYRMPMSAQCCRWTRSVPFGAH